MVVFQQKNRLIWSIFLLRGYWINNHFYFRWSFSDFIGWLQGEWGKENIVESVLIDAIADEQSYLQMKKVKRNICLCCTQRKIKNNELDATELINDYQIMCFCLGFCYFSSKSIISCGSVLVLLVVSVICIDNDAQYDRFNYASLCHVYVNVNHAPLA